MTLTDILKLRFATLTRIGAKVFRRRPRFQTITKAGPKSIAVKLESDLSITSGIAMFTVTPSRAITERDTLIVSIRCADVQPVRFDKLPQGAFPIGVHTHFLPNGTHNVDFSVMEDDREIFKGTILISVAHESELAKSVETIFKRHRVALAFRGTCDASYYPYGADDSRPWFDREDADAHIDGLLKDGKIDSHEAVMLRNFVRDGYLVIESLIDEPLIDQVNAEIDHAISDGYQGYKKGSSARIEHLHQYYPNIRKLWLDKRHLRFADLIFNGRARPCQTLVFVCGSQQDVHSDVIHLTPFPAGYMCGIWIALQDVVPDSGELIVYPGTHRRKRMYLSDTPIAKVTGGDWSAFGEKVVPMYANAVKGMEPVVYRPKKGTVLIWHENLLHGGSMRRNQDLERRSMVIHTFADGAVVYYDSTGSVGTVVSREVLAGA
jgi:hypothetical protein